MPRRGGEGWLGVLSSEGVLNEGGPTALKSIDAFEEVERDRDFVVEGHVRAEKVIEGDEEGGEGDGAVF